MKRIGSGKKKKNFRVNRENYPTFSSPHENTTVLWYGSQAEMKYSVEGF